MLDTNVCDKQVGCVLSQKQTDRHDKPTGYWSHSLNHAEHVHDSRHRKCLAVLWAVVLLRPNLQETCFTICTDHDALRWILNLADASCKLGRRRIRLSEYKFDVVHRAGIKHQVADSLSQLSTDGHAKTVLDEVLPFLTITAAPNMEDAKFDLEIHYLANKNPDITSPALPAVYTLATSPTPPTEPTTDEFLAKQPKDAFCRVGASTLGTLGSAYTYNRVAFLVCIASIDGAGQKVLPPALQARILYKSHYPRLAGHPIDCGMYASMHREFYWPQKANDWYTAVKDCRYCAHIRAQLTCRRHLKPFPASRPLKIIAMNILGPLPKTTHRRQFLICHVGSLFETDKLTRAVPSTQSTAPHVSSIFYDHWIIRYRILDQMLTDNGKQFFSKSFETLCNFLCVKHLTTISYYPQTNWQAERYNKTIFAHMGHYATEHQCDRDIYVQLLTHMYDTQVHPSRGTPPSSFVLSELPSGPTNFDRPSTLLSHASLATVPAVLHH